MTSEDGKIPAAAPRHPPTRWVVRALVGIGGLSLLVSVLFYYLRPRDEDPRRCPRNLRSISEAILLYSIDHGGQLPDDFSPFVLNGDLNARCFICPGSGFTPAKGPTSRAIADELSKPGHCSYFYFGKGRTTTAPAGTVIACEPLTNHGGQGMNVLYSDGSVQWVHAQAAATILAEIAVGYNPPRPATQATTPRGP